VPSSDFEPELVSMLKSVLDAAVVQIEQHCRTPATKAMMAEEILRAASDGIKDPIQLTALAVRGRRQARGIAEFSPTGIKIAV